MKTINPLGVKAYAFNELSKDAQHKALCDQCSFWINDKQYDEVNKGNFEKAIDAAERMKTPWFIGNYVVDYCKDELINEININEYLYDETGEMYPLNYYMNNNQIQKITYTLTRIKEIEVTLV